MQYPLIYEKGTYTLCEYYPSNNDGGKKAVAIHLQNEKDKVFDGAGRVLSFTNGIFPIVLDNCTNVTLKNFSIDYDYAQHFEGDVLISNQKGFLCKAAKGFTLGVKDGLLVASSGGDEIVFERIFGQTFDVKRKAPCENQGATMLRFFKGNKMEEPTLDEWIYVRLEQMADGVFFHVDSEDISRLQIPQGSRLVFGLYPRIADAIFITNSVNIRLENIDIYRSPAMGVIAQLSENLSLKNVNVKVKENRKDLISTVADATHFVNCYGEIHIEDCSFYNMLDDATNIHGIYGKIVDIKNQTLTVQLMHPQQKGVTFIHSGDVIKIMSPETYQQKLTTTVVESALSIDKQYIKVSCSEQVTCVAVGDVIDNVSAMPEVYISGCATGNNRPRGFLLTSGKKMEVKGCFFENSRSAIHVSSDAGKWYESGNVYQLYIHDNHFKNCNYSTGTAAITICSPAQIDDVFVHHNIDIKNNLVELDRGDFVDLFGVEDVRIENNKIRVSSNKQQIPVNNVFVKVASCKDVKINNNTRV